MEPLCFTMNRQRKALQKANEIHHVNYHITKRNVREVTISAQNVFRL